MTPTPRRHPVGLAALLAVASLGTAHAQTAAPTTPQQLGRIEITGSAIKRSIADEGALPISVLKVEDLRRSGVSSVEQIVDLLAASQSSNTGSNSIGASTGGASYANLRGLGSNKTLILLNGRRVTAFAFGADAVDLNAIPFAVIDRVEVLRDGASAVYGTDAIGGVINFITRNSYRGGQLVVEASRPQQAGGRKEGGSVSLGFGDLEKDRINVWGSFDQRRQQRVRALDRDFAKTGILPARGVSGSSGTTFPGNFSQGNLSGNPAAPGCAPPLSLLSPTNPGACIFDFSSTIDILPDVRQQTLAGRFSAKLGEDHLFTLDGMSTTNDNTSRVAPDPVSGLTIRPDNPFYPSTYPGLDTTRPVSAGWRMVPAGPRTNGAHSSAERLVADVSGTVRDWDYKVGALYSRSRASDEAVDGYVNAAFVRDQVAAGRLNPFAPATPAQLAIIEQAKRRGVFSDAVGTTRSIDARVSGELFALPGGRAAMAISGEFRKEDYRNDTHDEVVLSIPSAGRSPNHVSGRRDVKALGIELLLPLHKMAEVQLALRTDDYSDAGRTTNPKIGLRVQPMKSLALRASYNTGFRAPALDDLYAPQSVTYAAGAKNDPLLCDANGKPLIAKGGIGSRDCSQQPQVQLGGNPKLKPEKSRTFTVGAVFEPVKQLTFTVDYWNIQLRDQISALPVDTILANPDRYAARIFRCNALSASEQAELQRCQGLWGGSPAIGYLATIADNIGRVKTDGLDLGAAYQQSLGAWGNLSLSYEGTYVHRYLYQDSPDDPFKSRLAYYRDESVMFRWKHHLSASWSRGAWGGRLAVRHQSGYRDQNDAATVVGGPSFYGDVKPYTLVDLSGSYQFGKATSVTLGVRNLFDTDPPFSNQSSRSQRGFDSRYTDATGRAVFVRVSAGF
ncbi:TonB-dependent receptor [Roseateles chitosanitabidus]|uniref:TonB-dependent receptor n=1 Tax=Roseateles chitosanitabidus TaxID=65048 RepID=UPI000A0154C4|nr:TonB-dependent receptor [Roseateles chitosanitabidus]